MNYIYAEHLKHKRTFTKKLLILAPLLTALTSILAPVWFQVNSYNWWYVFLYPGFLTLLCSLMEQKDNGKLSYRAVFPLPVSLSKVWHAKTAVAGLYAAFGNLVFLILNLTGAFVFLAVFQLKPSIGVFQALAGTLCILLASLWEIPLCLWMSRKLGIFLTLILNAGVGSVVGSLAADSSWWMLCPYSWVSRLMIPVLGILPNGEPCTSSMPPASYIIVFAVILLSLALCALLCHVTARDFSVREGK